MRTKINIGIADDHVLVRAGFVSILKSYKHINIQFEAGNGKELLERIKEFRPDIVLLDIEMPFADGIEVMPGIAKEFPELKLIVISAHSEPRSVIEYVQLGAVSFLPKDCTEDSLVKAINSVSKNGIYFDSYVSELLGKNGVTPKAMFKERHLTENEKKVLKYLCEKNGALKDIEADLNISIKNARYYKRILFIKTHTQDIEGLIEYAERNGINS